MAEWKSISVPDVDVHSISISVKFQAIFWATSRLSSINHIDNVIKITLKINEFQWIANNC